MVSSAISLIATSMRADDPAPDRYYLAPRRAARILERLLDVRRLLRFAKTGGEFFKVVVGGAASRRGVLRLPCGFAPFARHPRRWPTAAAIMTLRTASRPG
jgi:hypothetical protein